MKRAKAQKQKEEAAKAAKKNEKQKAKDWKGCRSGCECSSTGGRS